MQNIVIVDYGMGNLRSVQRALLECGAKSRISSNANEIIRADKIILPGVGHFGNAMKNLQSKGLSTALNKAVLQNEIPILGICLGMQIMGLSSEEGNIEGLGWINARIHQFNVDDTLKFKVPHIGWNNVLPIGDNTLFKNITKEDLFYFVHSFHAEMIEKKELIANTNYCYDFPSVYGKKNIFGVQFHPEKSHEAGLKMLTNFINL